MSIRYSLILIIFFSYGITIGTASTSEFENQKFLNDQIKNTVSQERIAYHLPALSVSIHLPGETALRNYVSGDDTFSDKKRSITPNTLFQIGSITKTFTATIIYQLIQERKFQLADPLSHWLPQYPRWKEITIKDLLWHTSGIADYTHGKDFDELLKKETSKVWTLDELANIAYHHPDLSKPGKKYHYTNTDYILLGMLIEKMTRKTLIQNFSDYFHQYHLAHTYYFPSGYPEKIKKEIAHGYNQDGTFQFNQDVTWIHLSFSQSAGGIIYATGHFDLVRKTFFWKNDYH